jgi:hypothetical protein
MSKTEEITKSTEVVLAEDAALIALINRKARIQAIEDYMTLIVGKSIGLVALIVAGIVFIKPDVLPLTQKQGLYALSGGIALLVGDKAIAVLRKFFS